MSTPYLTLALKAGIEASQFIKQAALSGEKRNLEKKKTADFVTEIDKGSEKIILSHIHEHFPSHSILAEESGQSGEAPNSADNPEGYQWIIDPLDGTTNFIRGIPNFAVSIGLRRHNEIVMGIVIDVMHDDVFSAEKGKGAMLNDAPIFVSGRQINEDRNTDNSTLENALLATGIPFGDSSEEKRQRYLKSLEPFMHKTMGVRRVGAAALDLAYVAAGRFDGFWEIGLSPWDIAAGVLLVREAGGKVGNFQGEPELLPTTTMLAANPEIFNLMQKTLYTV